jgi:hypothetical protein
MFARCSKAMLFCPVADAPTPGAGDTGNPGSVFERGTVTAKSVLFKLPRAGLLVRSRTIVMVPFVASTRKPCGTALLALMSCQESDPASKKRTVGVSGVAGSNSNVSVARSKLSAFSTWISNTPKAWSAVPVRVRACTAGGRTAMSTLAGPVAEPAWSRRSDIPGKLVVAEVPGCTEVEARAEGPVTTVLTTRLPAS